MKDSASSLPYFVAIALFASCAGISHVSAAPVLLPIPGVTASSPDTTAGTPNSIASNGITGTGTWSSPQFPSLQADTGVGGSGVVGASDSLADSGLYLDGGTRFGDWVAPIGATITFNLGATYNVSDLLVWNYDQIGFSNAGPNSVTVLSSATGLAGSFSFVQNVTFNQASLEAPYGSPTQNPNAYVVPAQIVPVNIPNAHYVELVLNTNHGFSGALGLNEVNFVGAAVPEPTSYAMLLAGLAVLGLCLRRKQASK